MFAYANLAAPMGRTLLGGIFVLSGLTKIGAYEATQGYMNAMGVPGALLPAVIAFEILTPIALIVGFYARSAAFLLAGFSVLTALIFHFDFADQMQSILFLKNLSIAGGLLLLTSNGPGALSLDPRR